MNTRDLPTFEARFRYLRTEILKLKGREIADGLGVSASQISQVEGGRVSLSRENFGKLSTVFNVNLNWLLTGEGLPLNDTVPQMKMLPKEDADKILWHLSEIARLLK